MPNLTIAIVCSKGGTGKTMTAMTLATHYALHYGDAHIIDLDPQESGSSWRWLESTDDGLASLWWSETTVQELMPWIEEIDRAVFIDTPPRIKSTTVQTVAAAADLVIIPGMTEEIDSIVETSQLLETSTPRVALITRTPSSTLSASTGAASIAALNQIGIPVIGCVRHNPPLGRARIEDKRPDQITPRYKKRLDDDIASIFTNLIKHLPEGAIPNA